MVFVQMGLLLPSLLTYTFKLEGQKLKLYDGFIVILSHLANSTVLNLKVLEKNPKHPNKITFPCGLINIE